MTGSRRGGLSRDGRVCFGCPTFRDEGPESRPPCRVVALSLDLETRQGTELAKDSKTCPADASTARCPCLRFPLASYSSPSCRLLQSPSGRVGYWTEISSILHFVQNFVRNALRQRPVQGRNRPRRMRRCRALPSTPSRHEHLHPPMHVRGLSQGLGVSVKASRERSRFDRIP